MKKTLLIASLLTSVLAVAGTTGSVEFNNNTKSTVTNFTKDGVKDAITGTEFDSGLKGEIKVNDLFAAGFEIGNKNAFDNFTVNKDTLFDHSEPSVWFEVMKNDNYFKTTLKPHKVDKGVKGEGTATKVLHEDYVPGENEYYQDSESLYVLRPELELNLQKSLDDLTFKANVKSEFNAISKEVKGEKVSEYVIDDGAGNNIKNNDRKIESNPTYVDPTLKFNFSASKGDLAGVKGATADVMLNFKGEDLGFANTGLTLSGNYDLNKTTNIALETKVNYKKQDAKSLAKKVDETVKNQMIAYSKAMSIENAATETVVEGYKNYKAPKTSNPDAKYELDGVQLDKYKKFIESTKKDDENGKLAKAYKKQIDEQVENLLFGKDKVYLDAAEKGLDRNLDFGNVNDSYALDVTYKLGDQLSLGSSAYIYHAYNYGEENVIDAVLGAKLDANVNNFSFGTSVKGGLLTHLGKENTVAIKSNVNTAYKFNLTEGLTLTPSISGEVVASRVLRDAQKLGDRRASASVTPKVSLDYMKNGFVFGLGLESAYNFKTNLNQDAYFVAAEAKTKAETPTATDADVTIKYSEVPEVFGFVNNVFKAGLKLGYNW